MKIAVIGGGAAGLAAIRYVVKNNYECDCFEQTGSFGGTWVYNENVAENDGYPVHSPMYVGLRTNLPKELMAFEDFTYPQGMVKSYLDQKTVLKYIQDYVTHFQLEQYIKYYKRVTNVLPLDNRRWLVEIKDVKGKKSEKIEYDAVMVCNGHFFEPMYPTIEGTDSFHGRKCHSHSYRTKEPYRGLKVLIIGGGPSGVDIGCIVAQCANKVFISHKREIKETLHENITLKPVVKRFKANSAVFIDDTEEEIDAVVFCTGYKYSYPFLSPECGIFVEDNHVQPLYKQIINIEHPTMCLIGLPFKVLPFPLFCIQARYFLASLSNHFQLPSKEDMLKEAKKDLEMRLKKGWPKSHAHKLGTGTEQSEYYTDLAQTAKIKNLPVVVFRKLYDRTRKKDLKECFKIIDDETFIQIQ